MTTAINPAAKRARKDSDNLEASTMHRMVWKAGIATMVAGLEHLELFMMVATLGVFLFFASAVIFLLEEAGKIFVARLSSVILFGWAWISGPHPGLSRLISHVHGAKP